MLISKRYRCKELISPATRSYPTTKSPINWTPHSARDIGKGHHHAVALGHSRELAPFGHFWSLFCVHQLTKKGLRGRAANPPNQELPASFGIHSMPCFVCVPLRCCATASFVCSGSGRRARAWGRGWIRSLV